MAFLARSVLARAPRAVPMMVRTAPSVRTMSGETLSDADFDAKWVAYFSDETLSNGEIRRGLNDVFAHDLIPDPTIIEAALRSLRRSNDFATTVRVFEGIKDKSPDDATYAYVVGELRPVMDELNLSTPEELGI